MGHLVRAAQAVVQSELCTGPKNAETFRVYRRCFVYNFNRAFGVEEQQSVELQVGVAPHLGGVRIGDRSGGEVDRSDGLQR